MRILAMVGVLATATAFGAIHANAVPLAPTLEFTDGLVASVPVTTGSISFGGVTTNGAPVVGSATQQVLQLNGSLTTGFFNPLSISASEFNLSIPGGHAKVAASISGVLGPLSTLSWNVYLDAGNNPFGTAQLIASGSFTDPSSLLSIGFSDPVAAILASVRGPFSLSEFVSISAPAGTMENFTSSVTATSVAAPEPVSLAILGSGLLALGLITPAWRRRTQAQA
jgi:hypothetical protein